MEFGLSEGTNCAASAPVSDTEAGELLPFIWTRRRTGFPLAIPGVLPLCGGGTGCGGFREEMPPRRVNQLPSVDAVELSDRPQIDGGRE